MAGARGPTPPDPSSEAIVELAARLRLSTARLARLLRQQSGTGLSPSQQSALATIEASGPLTLGELAAAEQVAPPTVTKVVSKLEDDRLVSRAVDEADRRVVRVRITAEGRRRLEHSRRRRNAWLAQQLAELAPDDVARVAAALEVLERLAQVPEPGAAMTDRILAVTRETFRSLRVRNFRLFFVGQAISQAGTWMQSVAIVWVVLKLTDDGFALGLATAAQFLPILLLGAWSGVLSDRVDKHRLLVITQVAFTVLAAVFSMLLLTDHITIGLMYALSGVFGLLTALDNPSRRAFVAELVPVAEVANVVGLNSALMTGSRVVGPAIAGALISGVGVEWCFVVNAFTYVAVIVALLRMDRSQFRSPERVARARGQVREGLRYVWSEPQLRLALVLVTVVGTFAFNYQIVLPLLAERTFGAGAGGFTILFSMLSVGSLLGALVVARRSTTDVSFLVRGSVLLAVSTCALAAAPSLLLAAVLAVPVGYYAIFLISGSNAVVQLRAAPTMRGRALALLAVVFLGSTPIGGPIAGWVSEHIGPRAGLLLGAVATAAVAVWVRSQVRGLRGPTVVLSPQVRVAEPLPS